MSKFCGGTSVLFVDSHGEDMFSHANSLLALAERRGLKLAHVYSLASNENFSPGKSIFYLHTCTKPLSATIAWLCSNKFQFVISTTLSVDDIADCMKLIKQHKIEVVQTRYISEDAKQWAKAWSFYRSPETSVQAIVAHLEIHHDCVKFLSLDRLTDREKMISLWLLECAGPSTSSTLPKGSVVPVGSQAETWLKNYVSTVTMEISRHLILVVAKLVLQYL